MQFVPVKEHRLRHQIIMSFPFLFEMDAYICMTTGYHISFSTTSLSEKYKEKAIQTNKETSPEQIKSELYANMANPRNITLSQKRSKSQNTNDSIHMKFITIQHRTIYSSGITLKSMAGNEDSGYL